MHETRQRAEETVQRLLAVDLSSVDASRRVIERGLEEYFRLLGLTWRPLSWAEDALSGFEMACRSPSSAAQLSELLNRFLKKPDVGGSFKHLWTHGWRLGQAAIQSRVWERVKTVVGVATEGVAERFVIADDEESKRREARRQKSLVWHEVMDVTLKIPLVVADLASRYAGGGTCALPRYAAAWGPFVDAYEAGLWLFWVTERETVIVPRPLLRLERGADETFETLRLHSLTGPAVYYPTGESYYFIHGVRVTAEMVETPAHELDPHGVITEPNSEVRRELFRKIGVERLCQAFNAKCIDTQGEYELLLLDLRDGRERPFLKMRNPSVGVFHIEGVDPHCRTVREALEWRNQTHVPPAVLT